MAQTRLPRNPFARVAWLALAALIAAPAPARAAPAAPDRAALTWATLPATARASFDAGPGRRWQARISGARAAGDAVSGDLEALDVATRWDHDFTGPEGAEVSVDALVVYRLGGVADARRAAWRVGEHLTEQAHFLAPVRAAVERQLVSQLLVSDLEVEVARVEIEATRMRGEADVAARELAGLLGVDGPPSAAGLTELDDVSSEGANPWDAVRARLDAHPELATLDAAAAAAAARADAADRAGGTSVHLGAGFRHTGDDSNWLAALVGVSIPLGNPTGDAAEELAAEATALREQRTWRLSELRAEVATLAARYDAAVARLRRIREALVVPMGDRVILHERAVLAGRSSLEQLVRARRDLLEAHHDLVHTAAEVLAHQANATAMQVLLTPQASQPPGARP
jgi:hypothetical protein